MRIVIYSPNFFPLTGGLESMALDMATEFSRLGHSVTVITLTTRDGADDFPFGILRRPGFLQQVRAMRRADVILQFNVSLKGILPWLLSGRPLVVSHQTPNTSDWRGRLKAWIARRWAAANIGCSRYMSAAFTNAATIPNAFDHALFRVKIPWEQRRLELVFVGRLVSDKGADVLLRALALLQEKKQFPHLTIVGGGSEESTLRALVLELGLQAQVEFAGQKKGEALVDTLNNHQIMVIPSVWKEPFGIVALEGLACGCIVLGSEGGGLPEAMGGLGVPFPNNDPDALALALEKVLAEPSRFRAAAPSLGEHLNRHRKEQIAAVYLRVLEASLAHR